MDKPEKYHKIEDPEQFLKISAKIWESFNSFQKWGGLYVIKPGITLVLEK